MAPGSAPFDEGSIGVGQVLDQFGAQAGVPAGAGDIAVGGEMENENPEPFVSHKQADQIIEKVRRGRAKLHQIKSATDHQAASNFVGKVHAANRRLSGQPVKSLLTFGR